MTRSPLLLAPAAALVAGAIAVGVAGSPVDTADAARPFQVSKSQFTTVQKTAVAAMKKSNANATAIAGLKTAGTVAAQGVQGPPGPAGGFDPTKVGRVAGTAVTVSSAEDYQLASVTCPGGSIALSGGWIMETDGNEKYLHVARSYPSEPLGTWTFRFAYTGAGTYTVTPYALCAAP